MSLNESPTEPVSSEWIAQSLATTYASAYQAKDEATYISLFAKDAEYYDFGVQVHGKIRQLKEELRRSFQREEFRLSIRSFFVSSDGRFVALQGAYTDSARSGQATSVPFVSILEIRSGEIFKESIYYDGSEFKRHFSNDSRT